MQKGEIWQVNLPAGMEHEQEGVRPAIIVVDIGQAGIVIAVPLTKTLEAEKFKHTWQISPTSKNGLSQESVALVFQMRALSKDRLKEKLGHLDDKDISHLNLILKDMLKLQ